MRYGVLILALLIVGAPVPYQKRRSVQPLRDHFVIARQAFGDFGPPFGSYDLFIVRAIPNGSSIERIVLTPYECIENAKAESAVASIKASPAELLGPTSPCPISDRELSRELKRKRSVALSGANVTMQVQCGDQTRIIRSDILDRDMFDPASNAPSHTAWTMRLLQRMDQEFGGPAIDQPFLPIPESGAQSNKVMDSVALREVGEGKYDALFQGASEKPSELYRVAQIVPAHQAVQLMSALPVHPEMFALPEYPQLARMARVWGTVSFKFDIDPEGVPVNLTIESGPAMLQAPVKKTVNDWRFPKNSPSSQVQPRLGSGWIAVHLYTPSRLAAPTLLTFSPTHTETPVPRNKTPLRAAHPVHENECRRDP